MRTIIKKYDVYKFDELSEEIKEKLIEERAEKEREIFCEWELETLMTEEASNILENTFTSFNNVDVVYDLSYSQGSGAMIQFDIPIEDVNKKLKIFTDKELEILTKGYYSSLIKIRHNDNFYCHEYTFKIIDDLDYCIDAALYHEEITENKYNKLEKKLEKMRDLLKDIIIDMNVDLKKYGYSLLEDFDFFKEQAVYTLSDYEYLENGELFNV